MHYIPHLQKDRKLKKIIGTENFTLQKRKNIYLHLCASIMSQQLNVKVADIIHKRFLALYKGKTPAAADILTTPYDTLRSVGLSNAKVTYVHNVCRFFIENKVQDKQIHKMSDAEVIAFLTQIKGVGRWTCEMALMFYLGRENVFSAGDLGIQMAMIRLYGLDSSDKKQLLQDMEKIAEKWSPYRTYACRYLWAWKDGD